MSEKITKPFALEYADAQSEIIAAVNKATKEHGIPCFLLLPMIDNITQQLRIGANAEKAEAEYTYNEQMKKAEKKAEGKA